MIQRHAPRTSLYKRGHIDRLLDLAAYLPRRDRLLLEQMYRHGLAATDIATLTGTPPWTVRRRISRILRRLRSPMFRFMAQHAVLLSPEVRRSALVVYCRGHSLRQTVRLTGASLHQVRKHLQCARALARV